MGLLPYPGDRRATCDPHITQRERKPMQPSIQTFHRPVALRKKAEQPLPASAVSAIADLRESWHRLHDLDRALAIRKIVQLGVDRRRLAREMGFSEGLFRHLLKALTASPADQELARQNLISTNELVRRATGRSLRRSPERLPVRAAIRPVPLLKRDRRTSWTKSTQIPPAAVRLLEMYRNCTGY